MRVNVAFTLTPLLILCLAAGTRAQSTSTTSSANVDYSGPDQNSPLDITAANTGSSNSLDSGLATPAFANELVFGAVSVAMGIASAGNGFGSIQESGGNLAEDDVLISHAEQHATGTSSAPANWAIQMATFRDSAGTLWSGSQSFAGPRPYIDVTAFGAKGDGSTDDTTAIGNAITAACAATATGGIHTHPEIWFTSGVYILTQAQGGTMINAAVFELPCSGLTFRGLVTSGGAAFGRAPLAWLVVKNLGSSPSNGPVFDCRYPNCNVATFINLEISGYNKAMWFYTSGQDKLENVTLTVQNTSQPDNVPLMLTNVFWFEWHGGGWLTNTTSGYGVLMTGGVQLGSEAPLDGLVEFDNLQGAGGSMHYDQRVATTGSGPGNFSFNNIRAIEAGRTPMFYITNSGGGTGGLPSVSNVTFNNVTTADWLSSSALVELNSSGTVLSGVIIDMSQGSGTTPNAVQVDAGTVQACTIRGGGNQFSAANVVDNNGNPIGGCVQETLWGFDYNPVAMASPYDQRFRSDIDAFQNGARGPVLRATLGGNRFAGLGLDPVTGLMVNDGTEFGFGAGINQSVHGRMDVLFPSIYPPTSLSGSPITGGSIANGTYYGTIYSTTSTCVNTQSAPSIQSAGVTLSGANNAIAWMWTLPSTGVGMIAGYCIAVSTVPNFRGGQWQPVQSNYTGPIGTASTTSYTMTVLPSSGGQDSTVSPLVPAHSFTPNSLGINTQSPAYDLDVTHTTATNNGIRATGANLTSLTPSSAVCTDASKNLIGCSGPVWTDSTIAYAPNTMAKYLGVNGAATTPVSRTSEGSMETPVPNNRTVTITGITLVAGAPVGSGIAVTAYILDVTASTSLSCTTNTNGTSCANTGMLSTRAEDMLVEEIVASGTATSTNYSISVTYQ